MSSESPLLNYEPPELSFLFGQNGPPSSTVQLFNKTDKYVAFKLKSTNPRNYVVKPRIGILLPRSTREIKVIVTTRVLREAHHNMRCKDKFMIESAATAPDTTLEDARKLFDKNNGHAPQESILQVVYSKPSESSPRTSAIGDTEAPAAPQVNNVVTERHNVVTDPHDNCLQVTSPVTEPHDSVLLVTNHVTERHDNESQEDNIICSGESFLRGLISNITGESILKEVFGSLLVLVSLYIMKRMISGIRSLVMFAVMVIMKMIKKLVSDSVEDWIVKTLLHIVMYILFGRKDNTGLT